MTQVFSTGVRRGRAKRKQRRSHKTRRQNQGRLDSDVICFRILGVMFLLCFILKTMAAVLRFFSTQKYSLLLSITDSVYIHAISSDYLQISLKSMAPARTLSSHFLLDTVCSCSCGHHMRKPPPSPPSLHLFFPANHKRRFLLTSTTTTTTLMHLKQRQTLAMNARQA